MTGWPISALAQEKPLDEVRHAERDKGGSDEKQREANKVPAISLRPLRSDDVSKADNEAGQSEHDKRDLAAQEKMALWAHWMFLATVGQAVIGTLGLLLIFVTFRETRRSSNSGEAMAKEAALASQAAIRSAEVAERALKGIERPFLVVRPSDGDSFGAEKQAYYFENHGRTPCVIVHSDVRYLNIVPPKGDEPIAPNLWQAAFTPGYTVVGSGSCSEVLHTVLGAPIVPDAAVAKMWMLHGYVLYRSLTGDFFVNGFGLYKSGGEGPWKPLTDTRFNYDRRLEAQADAQIQERQKA